MNVLDAAYRTVHDYPGGAESLAPRLSMNPRVLCSKVNPSITTHRLALDEADRIIGLTGNPLILQALAASNSYGLYRIEAIESHAPVSVLDLALGEAEAQGEFAHEVRAALADGVITESEYKRITAAAFAKNDATIVLLGALRRAKGRQTTTV